MSDIVERLEALARAEHDDLSVAFEAASRIRELEGERDAALADNERLREALLKISSPSQTKELLWWQIEARAALKGE